MISMEAALALLAVSAPITVAVIKYVPARTRPVNAGITPREFRIFAASVDDKFDIVRADIRELRQRIDDKL